MVRPERLWTRRVGNRQTRQRTNACVEVTSDVRGVAISSGCQVSWNPLRLTVELPHQQTFRRNP